MDHSTPISPPSNPSIAHKPSEDPLPISLETTTTKSPPPSPLRKSKTRTEMAAEESPEPAAPRRRRRNGESQMGVLQSPKRTRRPRKRSELDIREEKDMGLAEEVGKPRKRRNNVRSKKEKVNLVPSVPPSTSSPKTEEENGVDLDRVWQLLIDLIMWNDVSKSTLWFGFGSLCFLSSSFTKGLNFSIFSALSQLAIPFLGVSFFSNSILQRNQAEKKHEFNLKENDILRLAKVILPALNLLISKTRVLFSGEPAMTLKVAPFLLMGAEYGHFITIWRLCAIGFFVSFTVPKLYSCFTAQINQRAECLKSWLLGTWCAYTHKKKVIALALMAFWKLSSVKTQIFTAFILLVLFRYLKQHVVQQLDDGETQEGEKEEQQASVMAELEGKEAQQALVVAEPEEKEPQKALVVWEEHGCQN